jgi:ATP-dependent Clp protease ATP-binding subunit ClpB
LHHRNITLELSPEARSFIARNGFDPVFGARPLKRFLQQELETRIGRALVADSVPDGSHLRVGTDEEGLTLAIDAPAPRAPSEPEEETQTSDTH